MSRTISFWLLSNALVLQAFSNSAAPAKNELWSIKPLIQPKIPASSSERSWPKNPIDHFISAKLDSLRLHPSPPADRRTLIRRASFDLTGLPPTPEDVAAFLQDNHPSAYEKLIDRLLLSPRYGERWARHWLDVVHYGETHGYDKDKPRPNAWPYRDYVIRSLNADKRYSRFIQEQIAGDVLFPFTSDGIQALGFISAGPWDLIGHEEVPESKMDGKIARHLDRDDMVMNTMQTFNSLTVQCAQCHNHKFDPISQEDYYSLQAVFAALDRTNKKYDLDPEVGRRRATLEKEKSTILATRAGLNQLIATRAGDDLSALEKRISDAEKLKQDTEAFGYHSAISKDQDVVKWVQIDLGKETQIQSILLHPCKDDFNNIGEGFGFPLRFKVEIDRDSAFAHPTLAADFTREDYPNPKLKPVNLSANHSGRFIRVTATRLAPRQDDFIFALAELQVLGPSGSNIAKVAPVSALDSIEAPVRWQKKNLTDGYFPGMTAATNPDLVALRTEKNELLGRHTTAQEKQDLSNLTASLENSEKQLASLPAPQVAYVASVHHGSGSFRGTGPDGGKPRPVYLLSRGNVENPTRLMQSGTVSCIDGLPSRFNLPADHTEGDRRAALAHWLSSTNNPLTWRSIVNRVWQYHFGRGLVETPNDFGRMGALPSHPELLDWLACHFRDHGQSLKTLHKLIMLSATYQQSSSSNPEFEKFDADNRCLWRMNRRKLEAEAVRDSILFVAGKLDERMGGPSFQDFVIDRPEHSPHYEYHLHDPEDPRSHRRSIYRFIVRSQPQPFMTTLDCADPSMQVPKRNETVSPLQSLTLLNNSLVLSMSKHFAARINSAAPSLSEKIHHGFYLALGRPPDPTELEKLDHYATQHGLTNLCRVLFNLTEFSFVD